MDNRRTSSPVADAGSWRSSSTGSRSSKEPRKSRSNDPALTGNQRCRGSHSLSRGSKTVLGAKRLMSAFDGEHWDALGVRCGSSGTRRTYPEPEDVVAAEREGQRAIGANPRERLAA